MSFQFRLRTLLVVTTSIAIGFAIWSAFPELEDTLVGMWLALLPIYSFFSLPIFGAVWLFGAKRASWHPAEVLLVFVPYTVWFALMLSPVSAGNKSLANLIEPVFFGPIAGLIPLPKIVAGKRVARWKSLTIAVAAATLSAIAVFFLTPGLPE